MIQINVPGIGIVQFPDGTPESEIKAAIERALARKQSSASAPPNGDETSFRSWYGGHAQRLGLDSDPDNPLHKYDYRAAYRAGAGPGPDGHWPSEFKADDHPNRFVNGVDTKAVDDKSGAREIVARWQASNPSSAPGAPERPAGFTDYVDRLGTAALANVSGPVDLGEMALKVADTAPGRLAASAIVPGGPSALQAAGRALVPPARAALSAAEQATNLPFTTESQQRHRERFRELEKPFSPAVEAAVDTGIEGAGVLIDPAGAGLAAAKIARPARSLARIDALKSRVDDAAKVAESPPPRMSTAMWGAYNQERAAIDAEVDNVVQRVIATTGEEPPPDAIDAMRKGQVTALNQRWHQQVAAQAAVSNDPGVHALADHVEQPAAFIEAPELPMADLLELQRASLKIADPELRLDRTYRGDIIPDNGNNPSARTYVYRDTVSGEDVGYLLAYPEPGGGFKAKHVWVEESHRGGSIPEYLYSRAYDDLGQYKGSTDVQGRRSIAGNRMHERLQRTVPHVFSEQGDTILPTEAFIRQGDPRKSITERLADFADRFIEEFSNKREPAINVIRKHIGDEQARTLELWMSQASGAARVARNTLYKGVRHWDAATGNVTRTYDSARAVLGNLGRQGWRDLNDLFAAERHMSLLDRKQNADVQYAGELAARRAEIEARRQEVLGAHADVRRATKEGRVSLARQLRAERNESKAAAQMDVRQKVADVASRRAAESLLPAVRNQPTDLVHRSRVSRMSGRQYPRMTPFGPYDSRDYPYSGDTIDLKWLADQRANQPLVDFLDRKGLTLDEAGPSDLREFDAEMAAQEAATPSPPPPVEHPLGVVTPTARAKGKATAYGRTARENATLAESAATRLADASSFKANQAAIGDVIGDLAGASKTVEGAVTRRYTKVPPRVQRPPDSLIRIDPRGTKWAQSTLEQLRTRYGVNEEGQIREIGDIARRMREWSWQAVVEPLYQVGFLSDQAKAALAAHGDKFAPFARLGDEVTDELSLNLVTGTNAKPIGRIHGGLSPDDPIADPLETFIAQAQRITLWVERQRTLNQLGDFAEAFPDELAGVITKQPPNSTNGFQVYRDGVRHMYSAPDDVMRALSRVDHQQVGWIMQAGILAARTLRAGVTLSPDFIARNIMRDFSASGVYGAQSFGEELKLRPFTDFMVGLWAQTPFASPELRKLVFDWESAGGAMADIINAHRPRITSTAKAVAGLAEFTVPLSRTKANPRGITFDIESPFLARRMDELRSEQALGRIMYPFLRPLEGAAAAAEQAPRIGAFYRAKQRGGNDLLASWFSRNITLDFGRSGASGQRWNSVEAFANASLQDVARFSRALRDKPVQTTIAALTYITLPSLATYALHRDDPDYQARPEWEKASFYHLWKRDDHTFAMFPRPLGMLNLAFGYGIEKMLTALSGKYDEPVTELLATVFNETPLRYLPVQPDPDPHSGFRGSMDPLPTAAQPVIETMASEEGWSQFRNSPLVSRALREVLPEDRYNDTTTVAARKLGEVTGQAPLKIDHLIRNFGGTLFVQTLKLAERMAGADQLPPLPMKAKDIPVVGAFVSGNPYGFSTQPVQDFYRLEEAAREAAGSMDKAIDNKDTARYFKIISDNPEALIADYLYEVRAGQKKEGAQSLAQLRKQREEYRTMPGLTPERRYDLLTKTDMLISQTAISTMHFVAQWRAGHEARMLEMKKRNRR